MLKVRLQRVGRKNDPSFRVVVIESHRAPKSGAAIEILGNYNARQKRVVLKRERIDHWVSQGAQMSQTVKDLMRKNPAT
jgi:small subunit ribosomal protein S16